jgi:YHS domain-containing protein
MDERVSTVYEGQVFEFCCKPCLKKFNKDPKKYHAMLAVGKSS